MNHSPTNFAQDLSTAALKAAPPAGVTMYGAMVSGLPTLVALATLIYIILQVAHLIWKWRREARSRNLDA